MGEIISGERRITTEALMARAARAASGLASLGVRRGGTVALYLRNDIAFFEASFAAGLIGAYPTPVNWHYTEDEARYLLENSGARVIVIHADLLGPVRGAIPTGVPVLVVETPPEIAAAYGAAPAAGAIPDGMTDWSGWLDGFEPHPGDGLGAPGTIIYTSGTTGRPKGVRRHPPSLEQMALGVRILGRAFGFQDYADDPASIVAVMTGPMYHSAPNAYGLSAARMGARVVLQARFDAEDLLRLIEAERVTHIHMVPIMFNRLIKLPEAVKARYDLSSLRDVVHAAAPCPAAGQAGDDRVVGAGDQRILRLHRDRRRRPLHRRGVAGASRHGRGKALSRGRRAGDRRGGQQPAARRGSARWSARVPAMGDFTYHGDDQKRRATAEKVRA